MADLNNLKVYVAVKVDFRDDGIMLPREITWEDGTKYEVDRVLDIRQAPAMKAGGQGGSIYNKDSRPAELFVF